MNADRLPLRLHVAPGGAPAFDHTFAGDVLVIGRASSNDLPISDPFLSRRHARLFRQGADLFVEDLGSRYGTQINGRPVQGAARVRPGDAVKIAETTITIQVAASPQVVDELPDGTRAFFRPAVDLLGHHSSRRAASLHDDALRRYAARLQLLNEVHQELERPADADAVLILLLDRLFAHLHPERGAAYLRRPHGLERAAARSASGRGDAFPVSRSLEREVAGKGLAALVVDTRADERFAAAESLVISGVRSLVAAPFLSPEGPLGMIVLDATATLRPFDEDDLELLVCVAAVAALHLRNLALAEEAAERRRLAEELALARRIQVALLPAGLPAVPGWELYGGNVPSRGVSGDYYQVVERAGGAEYVLLVADISGKGMAASLLTASLEALVASLIEEGLPPDELCTRLSRLLHRRTPPERYATAFIAVLAPASGRLLWANAGHNPPLLLRAEGAAERLGSTGVPLGLLPAASYRCGESLLAPGDLLVLYTDGIVEAIDPQAEEYGTERLQAACQRHRALGCDALAEALEEDLDAFVCGTPFADDRTIVLLRRLPA
jgi:phosphoserine phosphatase RsbU/P